METNQQVIFNFLDSLRDSGITNMFGAGHYVQEVFGLSRSEAKKMVLAWMESFNTRTLH